MSYIINIATAVPEFQIRKNELVEFYAQAVSTSKQEKFIQKIKYLNKKTKIDTRYSCISDYKMNEFELFTDNNFNQSIEKRMDLYQQKILPLSKNAIDKLFSESRVIPKDVTHLITVSCTGLFAPGLEFLIAEQYGLQHTEKMALNFLGCYAALKALKQAYYITQANPKACVLIVCAELCSLHFYPSDINEDIIANLLFSDGAAAVLVAGTKNKHIKNKVVLKIDSIGSAFIPNTSQLMTWGVSSTAFKMFLSSDVVKAIKDNIKPVVSNFLDRNNSLIDYWAIHPGGIKIIEAVQQSLNLNEVNVEESVGVLNKYGNMSSPTILFILSDIFNKIKSQSEIKSKKIFACAFGPGLNVELLNFSSAVPKNK